MFGHHVIDDFNEVLRSGKDPVYLDSVASAIKDIRQAQHFYLGAYQELIQPLRAFTQEQKETQVFLGASSKYARLPYRSCWFEFEDKSFDLGETLPIPKRGLHVFELDQDIFRVVIANWVEQWRKWVLNPQSYLVLVGRTFGEDPMVGPRVAAAAIQRGAPPDLVTALMATNVFPMPSVETLSWESSLGLRADDQRDFFVLNATLLLLNCKNIATEDNPPPPKLNKKRLKAGKQVLFTYKTLTLKLPGAHASHQSNGDSTGRLTKIHLCRGHFKVFSDTAPLFGKHTGLFWWDAHVRGDKGKGLLVKDYAVAPCPTEAQ